jgi:hypothetical protein
MRSKLFEKVLGDGEIYKNLSKDCYEALVVNKIYQDLKLIGGHLEYNDFVGLDVKPLYLMTMAPQPNLDAGESSNTYQAAEAWIGECIKTYDAEETELLINIERMRYLLSNENINPEESRFGRISNQCSLDREEKMSKIILDYLKLFRPYPWLRLVYTCETGSSSCLDDFERCGLSSEQDFPWGCLIAVCGERFPDISKEDVQKGGRVETLWKSHFFNMKKKCIENGGMVAYQCLVNFEHHDAGCASVHRDILYFIKRLVGEFKGADNVVCDLFGFFKKIERYFSFLEISEDQFSKCFLNKVSDYGAWRFICGTPRRKHLVGGYASYAYTAGKICENYCSLGRSTDFINISEEAAIAAAEVIIYCLENRKIAKELPK